MDVSAELVCRLTESGLNYNVMSLCLAQTNYYYRNDVLPSQMFGSKKKTKKTEKNSRNSRYNSIALCV